MSALPTRADLAGTPTRSELQTILLGLYDMVAQRLAAGTTGAGSASLAELLLARNSLGLGAGADIASAATLPLAGRTGNIVRVTGTIASTSTDLENGGWAICVPTGAWPLTYDATNMPIRGGANYTCTVGDFVMFIRDGSGDLTVLIDGVSVTQSANNNSTKNATTAYVDAAVATAAGIVKLNSGTVTAAATLDIVMTSYTSFKNKRLVLNNIAPANDATNLVMRFSTNGGSSYDAGASDYSWAFSSILAPSTPNDTGSTTDTAIVLAINVGNAAGESLCGNIELFNTNNTATSTRVIYDLHAFNSSGNGYRLFGGGARAANQDTDAIRLLFNSGNIASGTWTLYGWN